MRKLCFATNNQNKLREINRMVGDQITIVGLEEIGCKEELAEDGTTLEANSLQKAKYVADNYNIACFADDTGLEVFSLNGEPGVYSARYAGQQRDNIANMSLLLNNLQSSDDRSAQFRTVITYVDGESVHQFEGIAKGTITAELRGQEGFGYDPIFVPEDYAMTFAEMPMEEKNKISHRGRAFNKFLNFLHA